MSFTDEANMNHSSMHKKFSNKENIETLKKDINQLSYEESISELEIILTNVQDENISLDKIQVNYIKGHLRLKHCEELLQFVEQEINEINPEFLKQINFINLCLQNLYQLKDQSEAGIWDTETNQWVKVDGYRIPVRDGIRMANKVAPLDLLSVPVKFEGGE